MCRHLTRSNAELRDEKGERHWEGRGCGSHGGVHGCGTPDGISNCSSHRGERGCGNYDGIRSCGSHWASAAETVGLCMSVFAGLGICKSACTDHAVNPNGSKTLEIRL